MPAVQILPKKQLQIGHEHTKKLSLPHILGKGRWHRWELMKFCKKGSCLRARNSWDEETTKTSPSTRLRKQSPMNFPNKYYCIFSQPRQKMALTFHLPHFADLPIIIIHIIIQADFSKFIHSANKYLWGVMQFRPRARQPGCRGN